MPLPTCIRVVLMAVGLCWLLTGDGRAAERGSGFSAERFVRSFRSGRETVRMKVLGDIVRFHRDDPDVPTALGQALDEARQKDQLSGSVLRAVRLLGQLPHDSAVEPLTKLLSDPEPRIVIAAADGLAAHGGPRAVTALADLAGRADDADDYPLRHAAVCAIGRIREPPSVAFLIESLPRATGQLKFETARQLTRLTGQNFGGRFDDWQQWWNRNHADFAFAATGLRATSAAPPEPMPWDGPLPAFFSVPIHAYRVVFVIDCSRSMLSSVDGETRLERVKDELIQAIDELPAERQFEVIAFNDIITRWKGGLVPATAANKRDAQRFVRERTPRRKTASYDALQAALATDDYIEAVVFLSDGHPTTGRIVDPPAIVETVTAINQPRRIAIYTIAVDARDGEHEFMKTLAERNFGQFTLVR